MPHPSLTMPASDVKILELLDDGTLTSDPDTGLVLRNGIPPKLQQSGYMLTSNYLVHRVVYLAEHGFIGHLDINHRNRVRHDNRLCNLEAVTPRQNQLHALRSAEYLGTFPDEDEQLTPEFLAQVAALQAQGDVSRADVLALLGKADEPDGMTPVYPLWLGTAHTSSNLI